MLSDEEMKGVMQAYIEAFNRGDLDSLLELYADDAIVEDPVGTPAKKGKGEIAAFYKWAMEGRPQLALAAPIRGSHGNSAAMAFDVLPQMPEAPAVVRVIDVMTFNEEGKFTSMRAYWGPSDMEARAP